MAGCVDLLEVDDDIAGCVEYGEATVYEERGQQDKSYLSLAPSAIASPEVAQFATACDVIEPYMVHSWHVIRAEHCHC
jgi:hypothetical protein